MPSHHILQEWSLSIDSVVSSKLSEYGPGPLSSPKQDYLKIVLRMHLCIRAGDILVSNLITVNTDKNLLNLYTILGESIYSTYNS